MGKLTTLFSLISEETVCDEMEEPDSQEISETLDEPTDVIEVPLDDVSFFIA